jgi:hypothetical protein
VFSIFKNKADNAETFDSAVSFVAEFIQSRPWLDIPPDWYRGFPDSAFDKNIGTERDRQLIAAQIQELNPMLRMEATKHFQGLTKAFTDEKLKDGSVSQTTKESEKFLKVLAQDGRLNVGDYQKLKSWCYANGSSKHESETESEAISSSFKIKSTVPAIGDEPATEMMMVIVHRGSRCVVVPLPLVFESTFGGYWVEPGDHLFLARFKELPFRVQWDNLNDSKKVGITGMIASQGVWPTETRSLESVISSFRSDIDNGADMMLVAQVHNNMVFECMLPLSMTSLSAGRITQMASLVREWGLVDGQVVSFQNSGLSPLLVASTEKLRRATDLRRRLLADNSKLCQQVPPGDLPCYSSVSESTKVNASRITLANDTCNTFQDSLKSLRDITSNTLNKLPLRGN